MSKAYPPLRKTYPPRTQASGTGRGVEPPARDRVAQHVSAAQAFAARSKVGILQARLNAANSGPNSVVQMGKIIKKAPRVTSWKQAKAKFYGASKNVKGKRKRISGDAEHLARERYVNKIYIRMMDEDKMSETAIDSLLNPMNWGKIKKLGSKRLKVSYDSWKGSIKSGTLREAQHIIPASIAMEYGLPNSFTNSFENGMMLTAGARRGKVQDSYSKSYLKTKKTKDYRKKVMHVGLNNRLAHPAYNALVRKKLNKYKTGSGKVTRANAVKVVKDLRALHYTRSKSVKYSDHLK